jgi:hypothetical protein
MSKNINLKEKKKLLSFFKHREEKKKKKTKVTPSVYQTVELSIVDESEDSYYISKREDPIILR